MDARGDIRFRNSVSELQSGSSVRLQRKESFITQFPFDYPNYHLGRLKSPLEVCQSSVREMEPSTTSDIPRGKFETSSDDYYRNATNQKAPAHCNKFNVHNQKDEDLQVYVWCVGSLWTGTGEHKCNRNEIGRYDDIENLSKFCSNRRRFRDLQTSFGELRRVGVLGASKWTEKEIRTRACNDVYAMHRSKRHVSDGAMHIMPEAGRRVGSKGLGDSSSMVVDTFVGESVRRNIASSIRCNLSINSSDPEKLDYYYECIAEFGFDHIIVIGEMLYGLLFLDCYGRVFQWEDMEQVLWLLGDSLEDTNSQKDRVVWTVEDGVVYEKSSDSLKPKNKSTVKGIKNNHSKKKKKR